jgi:outer membrane protein OmpA-like peptidoglycan-associated protein
MLSLFKRLSALLVLCLAACAHQAPPPPSVKLAIAQTDRGVLIWLPDNVLFEFGKSELSPAADAYLAQVARLINEKTDHALLLEGHTDNLGAADLNLRLSEKRASAVASALKAKQVVESRLQIRGLGLTQPLAPNDTEVGRKLNRRVEIIVVDETVANMTKGEPEGAFEDAFAKLKTALGEQLDKQGLK